MALERLKKTELRYWVIWFYIWSMVSYYSKLLKIDAGNSPEGMKTQLFHHRGYTEIRFSFPKIMDEKREYNPLEMKEIFNQYLRYSLLPNQNQLKPYVVGDGYYDVMEALYVSNVFENDAFVGLDVVFVDNPVAFNYVIKCERQDISRIL